MAAGAPLGNKNASKQGLFKQALIREIKQRDLKDGEGETLRKIAAGWVDKASDGDISTGKEIRDTLDGKPNQSVSGPDGDALPVRLRVSYVSPGG